MQTLKTFLDQSLKVWEESTAAARFGIILLLLIGISMVVAVGLWSAQPHYVVLSNRLTPEKSTQLMASLDQSDIAYQIKGAGSIILVDQQDFAKASVLAGSQGIDVDNVEVESASPWMDPLSQQNLMRRNLEKQLAHSIKSYANIESATVHLSIPEKEPFLRSATPPSASVVLTIAHGQRFGETHAAAISQMIAHAVQGLRPELVTISDTAGNLYTSDNGTARLSKQEEYRFNREMELSLKAQSMLTDFLGLGNSRVAITADFSFPEGKTITKEYDPEKRVATSETVDSTSSTGGSINSAGQNVNQASGVAGTASNTTQNRTPDSGRSQTSKTEKIESTFEVSSTIREDIVKTPVMNAMNISVTVNSKKVQNENKEIPATVKSEIEAMVKRAVGFRDGADQFNLAFFEFVDVLPTNVLAPSAIPWDQIHTVLKNLSLGIAAILAFVFGRKALKNLQPIANSGSSVMSRDQGAKVSQLGDLVKQNPEVFAKILASWANEGNLEKASTPNKSKAA